MPAQPSNLETEHAAELVARSQGQRARRPRRGLELAEEALAVVRAAPASPLQERIESRCMVVRAEALRELLRLDEALEDARRVIDVGHPAADALCLASAHNVIGEVMYVRGDDGSEIHFQRAADVLADVDCEPTSLVARVQNNLGRVCFRRGDYPDAMSRFLQACATAALSGDRLQESICVMNQGNVFNHVGDLEAALRTFREALKIQRAEDYAYGMSMCLSNLAVVHSKLGDYESGLRYSDECLAIPLEADPSNFMPLNLRFKSKTLSALGRFDEAHAEASRALDLERELMNAAGVADSLFTLGYVLQARGDWEEAEDYFRQALVLMEDSPNDYIEQACLLSQAKSLLERDPAAAIKLLKSLRERMEKGGEKYMLVDVLATLSQAHERRAEYRPALEVQRAMSVTRQELASSDTANRIATLQVVHALEAGRHREEALVHAQADLERRVEERTAQLHESETRFRSVVEGIQEGILIHRHGRLVYGNPASLALLGVTSEQAIEGRRLVEFVHSRSRAGFDQHVAAVRAGVPGELQVELVHAPDGTTIHAEMSSAIVVIDGESAVQTVMRDVSERVLSQQKQQLLALELDHRVKNNLAGVIGIANESLRNSTRLDEFETSFLGRIHAMARTHEALAAARWEAVELGEILSGIIRPYVTDSGRLELDGPTVRIKASASAPLGLALHELTTNAVKHGALGPAGGSTEVSWMFDSSCRLIITWEEHDHYSAWPWQEGTGLSLIRGVVEYELGGAFGLENTDRGARCVLVLSRDLVLD